MVAILLALVIGACIGLFAAALLHVARDADDLLEDGGFFADDVTEAIAH